MARPQMIELLDSFRGDLEDLGNDLGVTDPVSGEVVLKLATTKSGEKEGEIEKGQAQKAARATTPSSFARWPHRREQFR